MSIDTSSLKTDKKATMELLTDQTIDQRLESLLAQLTPGGEGAVADGPGFLDHLAGGEDRSAADVVLGRADGGAW